MTALSVFSFLLPFKLVEISFPACVCCLLTCQCPSSRRVQFSLLHPFIRELTVIRILQSSFLDQVVQMEFYQPLCTPCAAAIWAGWPLAVLQVCVSPAVQPRPALGSASGAEQGALSPPWAPAQPSLCSAALATRMCWGLVCKILSAGISKCFAEEVTLYPAHVQPVLSQEVVLPLIQHPALAFIELHKFLPFCSLCKSL